MRFLYFILNVCPNRGHSGVCLGWWRNSLTPSCTYPSSISSSRPSVPSQWVRPEHGVVSPGKGAVSVFCRWHCHGISRGGRTQTGTHHCLPLHWWSETFSVVFFSFIFCFALHIFFNVFPFTLPCRSSSPALIILSRFLSVFAHHH